MIYHLLNLPYITYWLPIVTALIVAAPLIWLVRPRTALAASAGKSPPNIDAQSIPSSDQRKSFRRGGNSIGILYKLANNQQEPRQASVVDRSLGGLCLMTHVAVPVGTVLSVRPVSADNIIPWVEVEVCACRPGEDSFEVGCRFVKVPPYSILLLFG
jgi:hypothetical protein